MILPIYLYGSEVLRTKASIVDLTSQKIREEISKLVNDMIETMSHADGVGLAAPQVGKLIRLIVVDGTPIADSFPELENFRRVLINPIVLEESTQEVEYNEGCLSIPDINAGVLRPEKIKIKYFNQNFEEVQEELEGFCCRIVQHELDHLDGVLFVDKTAPIRKKMVSARLNNIRAGKVKTSYKTIN